MKKKRPNNGGQSTIVICLLLIFLTLLLFTLSSFEPNHSASTPPPPYSYSLTPPALQRLGTLYTRGTTAMNNIVLCHVARSVTTKQFKLFLRAFHRSALLSSSDLLLLFDSASTPDSFNALILQENEFFLKSCNGSKHLDFIASFVLNKKSKMKVIQKREPIWGRGIKRNNSSLHGCGDETVLTRVSYGSVVGFGVGELDPENSLSGFMDPVPMNLRRWASYPMILGRVRRNYKHVMLVDVQKVLLLGDPLERVKNFSPDSVVLSSTSHHEKTINPAVIMGGVRGVRRLSAAMLMEIVRATMTQQHNKRKISVTESSLLRRLATNEFTLRRIRIIVTSLGKPSSLSGSWMTNQMIVWRENYNDSVNTDCC